MSATPDTREQLLNAAEALFAERGFYGVSIAEIAAIPGLTKQGLLHHFPSKEKLYSEVLRRISLDFDAAVARAHTTPGDSRARLRHLLLEIYQLQDRNPARSALLMRELLDNKRRAESARVWYLEPFLRTLIDMTRTLPGWGHASEAQAFAVIYQLVGALTYFSVSQATLQRIFGKQEFARQATAFPVQLAHLIDTALDQPP